MIEETLIAFSGRRNQSISILCTINANKIDHFKKLAESANPSKVVTKLLAVGCLIEAELVEVESETRLFTRLTSSVPSVGEIRSECVGLVRGLPLWRRAVVIVRVYVVVVHIHAGQ